MGGDRRGADFEFTHTRIKNVTPMTTRVNV
jgi:hypothetical protein